MSRSEAIAAHIARSIMRNSNRRFSTLHADAIEETKMSDTTNNMNVGSQVNVGPIKPEGSKTLEGSYSGDHRTNPGDVAAASLATAADNGGPRNRVGQFDKPSTGAPEKFGSGSAESDYEGAGA